MSQTVQTPEFETEFSVYSQNLQGWLRNRRGEFVAIRGLDIIGFAPTCWEATVLALKQDHRLGDFLIQKIESRDTVEWVSHIVSG